ncbi:hypothetical protein [Roseospira navarrensis]|uniref:UrcA family protein n=1 Tax=Roseospira navarrensis TaxID=140058 RepID=A0A7X1ZBJ9_9PROT|nr:hypothetical protein [Roseospira navarrensis]MQX35540.1 hypothetical protein [Roseospira navarrensis]
MAALALASAPAGAADGEALEGLSPAALMAHYQADCAGGAGAGTADGGAAQARALGARCDALARAIQGVDLQDRRAGSADLARPDFYTPRSE